MIEPHQLPAEDTHQHPSEDLPIKESRFEQMASLAIEGLMVHANGIVLDANRAMAELVGCSTPEDLVGKQVLAVLPLTPQSREIAIAHLQTKSSAPFEIDLENADRTLTHLEVTCKDITYQGTNACVASIRDITQRKLAEDRLTRQLERLNVLHTIDHAVASVADLQTVLELLVKQIVEQIHVDACSLLLLDPQTQTLNYAAKKGFKTRALEFTRLPLGKGLAGLAALEKRIVHISDLAEIENNPSLIRALSHEDFVMYLGVPLVAKGNLLGVLEIFHRSRIDVDPNWLQFLEIVAGEAAIAIDNSRMLKITQDSYKEVNTLYQINKKLVATIDPQELMDEVVSLLQTGFNYLYVQIFVADPKTGNFVMRSGSGELGARLKSEGYYLSAGDGIVGVTAETGKPFFTNDVEAVFTFIRPPYLTDTKSELAVPIRAGSQFLGLLDIHQKDPFKLTERDVQLVTAVADQLAAALQKAALYADLQEALRQEKDTRAQLVHNEKLTVAGRLLASVSHELNNPIQAIQNALFLLKEEQSLSPQGKQDLEIVLSETERMAVMLARLRTTYRPINASEFKPVDIHQIIQDVSALVATHLRHHQITFELQAEESLPEVSGLEDQLRQVILNLVMNAAEAMSAGGHLEISIKRLADSKEVLITVSDTGPGIDEQIFPNIFEAFVTNKEQGTGLGLTISNEIITRHNGRIEIKNNPQKGASVLIWLPTIQKKGKNDHNRQNPGR